MRFGRWNALSEAWADAPPSPGIFQVRVSVGLIDYPRGKSAMVHYQAAADLRRAVAAFAADHGDPGWLCRHTVALSASEAEDVEAACQRLIRDFERRFGSIPRAPSN